jgi:hypothetical protein
VRIAPSGAVAGADTGHGVFATTDFQRNDVITEYAGVVMHAGTYSDPSDCMYDAAVISRDANEQLVIRGFRYTKDLRHVAQIANDARDARNNAMRMSIANAPFRGINETHGSTSCVCSVWRRGTSPRATKSLCHITTVIGRGYETTLERAKAGLP